MQSKNVQPLALSMVLSHHKLWSGMYPVSLSQLICARGLVEMVKFRRNHGGGGGGVLVQKDVEEACSSRPDFLSVFERGA